MKNLRLVRLGVGALIVLAMTGCTSDKPAPLMVLDPPPNTVTQVQTFLTEGNRLFREGRWEGARQQFQSAVQAEPKLAEAHYNLALCMYKMGDQAGAKKHWKEATDFAPGNKVIWDHPFLRRYGDVPDKPSDSTTTPVLPGVGGGGGGVGGGGPGGGF